MGKWLAGFLGTFLNKIVYRVLGAMGISVIAFVGIDVLSTQLLTEITSRASSIPSGWVSLISISGLDVFLTLVVSAFLSVFSINRLRKFLGIR